MTDVSFVRQPFASRCCGQACIAMLAGITLEEAIAVVGHAHGTRTKEIVEALKKLGFQSPSKLLRGIPFGLLSDGRRTIRCIAKVVFARRASWHWVVIHKGTVYDPELGVNPKYGTDVQIISFLWATRPPRRHQLAASG